ncbi:MAG: transcriptional regulator protein [Alphaproteobacteria bacterium]|nr:MAG: transcriptional regulator protein [Alphaproteobacteria bacterium]PZO41608.1 MAG: transcriptional regulator protein [Alphaproteobacteria bacterium]
MTVTTLARDLPDLFEAEINNQLEGLLGYQLRRTSLAMGADLVIRLEPLGLTLITMSILLLVESNPGITQSEIGRRLAIKRANMAPLTAQLSDKGLIDRVRSDGRSHGLSLTSGGQDLACRAREHVRANEARFLSRLRPGEQTVLADLLLRVRGAGDG